MRWLIGCEFSGVVRRAFRARGHDAWSCDLLPSEDNSPYHIQDDVLNHLDEQWDGAIFHPPCTYITNAGVRHLHSVPSKNGVLTKIHGAERWAQMEKACAFFNLLLAAPIPMVAVENPVPHRYAREQIGWYDQIIQPWQFGHGEIKKTCLWLKNLPHLTPSNVVEGRKPAAHMAADSRDRWKKRSRTYEGIGRAFATQWGQ